MTQRPNDPMTQRLNGATTQRRNDRKTLFAVILAGGSGTRFWPLSREALPKQMIQIVGEDTLLRQTIKRIQGFVPWQNIWVVTTEDKAQDIRFHLDPLGPVAKEIRVLAEPVGRNTAPAIGLAALCLHRLSPESVMIVMPSDHAIPDGEEFITDLEVAVRGAMQGYLVTLGINPSRPETGYGYIKIESSFKLNKLNERDKPNKRDKLNELDKRDEYNDPGLLRVERFLEKPDLQSAKAFLSEGGYFWNSGIFVWKTSEILSEIGKHLPSLSEKLREMDSFLDEPSNPNGLNRLDEPNDPKKAFMGLSCFRVRCVTPHREPNELNKLNKLNKPNEPDKPDKRDGLDELFKLYSGLDPVSIDYGVMERSSIVRMVPATFRWSDLGSWAALDEVVEKDEADNILRGNVIDVDSRNSIVLSDKRLIATIGLRDMAVIDTPDATLVIPKERAQEVRKIVEILKKKGREEHLTHRTVDRPWGSYTVLEKGNAYKIKRVVLKPGTRLSLQRHSRRSEHWVVVSGAARVTRGDETYWVQTNESTFIPVDTKHRLENQGGEMLQIIEVQSGDYLEEDDIERFEDDYGRR